MNQGFFLVVEGPNGAGKSSLCKRVSEHFTQQGVGVVLTSEPSQSPIGDLVRGYRERPDHVTTLACLLAADRYRNLIDVVRPSLAAGRLVISDRYLPSTFVYQVLHGLPMSFLHELNHAVDRPDLTVLVSTDLETLIARLQERGSNTFSENPAQLEREFQMYAEVDPLSDAPDVPSVRSICWLKNSKLPQ